MFQCPSTPNPNRVYDFPVPAGVLPGLPGGTLRAAASDYTATTGIRNWNTLVSPSPSETGLQDIGQRHGVAQRRTPRRLPAAGSRRLTLITRVGRQFEHHGDDRAGRTAAGLRPAAAGADRVRRGYQGAGWGDPFNGENWPSGFVFDGRRDAPPSGARA